MFKFLKKVWKSYRDTRDAERMAKRIPIIVDVEALTNIHPIISDNEDAFRITETNGNTGSVYLNQVMGRQYPFYNEATKMEDIAETEKIRENPIKNAWERLRL